ncbi:hypothetical protein K474DRAFT_1669018 [Panus rudis PR-1116 ss-1]|nr:hypothetical protein K474DRAFT_1669018 [Panus rudis PR-1116 ss-1]
MITNSNPAITSGGQEVTILVMGTTGAGKTTFINVASGSDLRVGIGLESCTDTIQKTAPFELNGKKIVLIDTPGFDDTTKSDAEVLDIICDYLSSDYQNGHKLTGIIYLHRITDNRMAGSAMRNFRFFQDLCGDGALANCAIVTNMWNSISKELAEARETELKSKPQFFRPALEKGAKLFRHDNTTQSAHTIISSLLSKPPVVLALQRELVDERKRIFETVAGATLLGEMAEQERKHQEELQKLQEELQEAQEQQDEESKREIEEARQELLEAQKRLQEEKQRLMTAQVTLPVTSQQPKPTKAPAVSKPSSVADATKKQRVSRLDRFKGSLLRSIRAGCCGRRGLDPSEEERLTSH